MSSFKFLNSNNILLATYEERYNYLLEYSAFYRNHEKGCLFRKSVLRTFVIPLLKEIDYLTTEDIKRIVDEHAVNPDSIPDGSYMDGDGFIWYEDGTSNYPDFENGYKNTELDSSDDIEFELNN